MKRVIKILLLLIILFLLFRTCFQPESKPKNKSQRIDNTLKNCSASFFNTTINNDTSKRDIFTGLTGNDILGLRLYNSDGNFCSKKNFTYKNKYNWDKFISIVHASNYSATYKILLLVDYKKYSYYVDNSLKDDFSFDLAPYQVIDIPVSIKKLSSGLHDIIFIITKNPKTGSGVKPQVNFLRYTIGINNDSIPDYSFSFSDLSQNNIANHVGPLSLTSNATFKTLYSTKSLKLNTSFNYYIGIQNSGNTFKNSQVCALVTLLDWEPTGNTEYFTIEKGKEMYVKKKMMIKNDGKHFQTAFIVLNPYKQMDNNSGCLIYSSLAVLNVKN